MNKNDAAGGGIMKLSLFALFNVQFYNQQNLRKQTKY